ncbi:MAG: hypothetical protein V2A73_01525 [Pseudomonadota bacterium]
MKFGDLLSIVAEEPLFETALLLAGNVSTHEVRQQLSRWRRAGRVVAIRRGLYALAPPYAHRRPHPFLIANRLVRGSYVSCQSALAYYGLIPESVPIVTSATTARPGLRETPLGTFEYRHVKQGLLYGYRSVDLGSGQLALVAAPEKALLDFIHLSPGGDDPRSLGELRLQNLDTLDLDALVSLARRAKRPKLARAASLIVQMAAQQATEWENL